MSGDTTSDVCWPMIQHILGSNECYMLAEGCLAVRTYAVRIALSDSWVLRQSNLPF